MNPRLAFKAAFLAECVGQGLTVDEIRDRAVTACAVLEKRAEGWLDAAKGLGGWGLATMAALPMAGGAAAGYALSKAQEDPGAVEDAKADELSDEYRRLASRLHRRRYYAEAARAGAEDKLLAGQASRRQAYTQSLAGHQTQQARLEALAAAHTRLSNRMDLPAGLHDQVRALGQEIESSRQSLAPPEPPAMIAAPTPDADPISDLEQRHKALAAAAAPPSGLLGRAVQSARSALTGPTPTPRVPVFA